MNRKTLLIKTTDNIRNINLLKERIINHKKSKQNLVITTSILLVLLIIFVWERVEIDAISLNINRLKQKKSSLTAYNEIMKAEIENKSRFESIDKIARNKLHMKFPGDNSVILVINKIEPRSTIEKFKELIGKIELW